MHQLWKASYSQCICKWTRREEEWRKKKGEIDVIGFKNNHRN